MRNNSRLKKQRGDTLIEVLIAVTVLAVIVTGAMAIMNRTLVSVMNSSERTAVRAEVNSQVEMLNWASVMDKDGVWRQVRDVAFNPSNIDTVSQTCRIMEHGNDSLKKPGSFYLMVTYDSDGNISGVKFNTNM